MALRSDAISMDVELALAVDDVAVLSETSDVVVSVDSVDVVEVEPISLTSCSKSSFRDCRSEVRVESALVRADSSMMPLEVMEEESAVRSSTS